MGNRSNNDEEKKMAQYLDELRNEELGKVFLTPKNEFEIILSEMKRRGIKPKLYAEKINKKIHDIL